MYLVQSCFSLLRVSVFQWLFSVQCGSRKCWDQRSRPGVKILVGARMGRPHSPPLSVLSQRCVRRRRWWVATPHCCVTSSWFRQRAGACVPPMRRDQPGPPSTGDDPGPRDTQRSLGRGGTTKANQSKPKQTKSDRKRIVGSAGPWVNHFAKPKMAKSRNDEHILRVEGLDNDMVKDKWQRLKRIVWEYFEPRVLAKAVNNILHQLILEGGQTRFWGMARKNNQAGHRPFRDGLRGEC